jgi:hypothetical protein
MSNYKHSFDASDLQGGKIQKVGSGQKGQQNIQNSEHLVFSNQKPTSITSSINTNNEI